jgi:hypothetical protein
MECVYIFNRRKLGRFRGRAAGPRRPLARGPSDPPSSRRGPFDCGSIRVSRPSNRAPALLQIANLREPVDLSRQRLHAAPPVLPNPRRCANVPLPCGPAIRFQLLFVIGCRLPAAPGASSGKSVPFSLLFVIPLGSGIWTPAAACGLRGAARVLGRQLGCRHAAARGPRSCRSGDAKDNECGPQFSRMAGNDIPIW